MLTRLTTGLTLLYLTTLTLASSTTNVTYAPSFPIKERALVSLNAFDLYDGANLTANHDTYTVYGCGAAGFPTMDKWISFRDMFDINKPMMFSSCKQFGQADNSGLEVAAIWNGIQAAAIATGVDHRMILATVMQESGGCVRVPTTNYGISNPGLCQSHSGSGTCNSGGVVQDPCPTSTIFQMITDGAAGTTSGDGLKQTLAEAKETYGETGAMAYYTAARIYNSGSVGAGGCLESGIATHCYASDIANRLTGWVFAEKTCTFDG